MCQLSLIYLRFLKMKTGSLKRQFQALSKVCLVFELRQLTNCENCGNWFELTDGRIPKNTPTATTWWVVFCGLDLDGWDMSTSAVGGTLQRIFCEATAIWETNDVENGWGNPHWILHRTSSEATAIYPRTAGDSAETNVQDSLGNTPKSLLGGESHLRKKPRRHTCRFAPRPSLWLSRNLLAVQDGSAPESHRESESNSAPKTLLWLNTQSFCCWGNTMSPRWLQYVVMDLGTYKHTISIG